MELILAHSPQAKGRVERRNALFQDRLVKELRLRNISDMAQANMLLEGLFLEDLNRRYAVKPAKGQDLHRAVPAGVTLEEVLCVQEQRVVGEDWCVRWRGRWPQIAGEHALLRLPRRRVRVRQLADGRLRVDYQGQRLTVRELGAKPAAPKVKKAIVNNRRYKPPTDHPWNRDPVGRGVPRVSLAPAAPARDLHAAKRKAG